tara:strand:+ start:837 stop:1313 length:477 start_codon:yes stop_codon:yes gene_type:complete
MSVYPMTLEGEASLREEVKKLKFQDRVKISNAIASARELGDLKENAEYHAAKEQQGLVESKIRDIESRLSNSLVLDILKIKPTGKVIFGVTVELQDIDTENKIIYKIVGQDEADVSDGKISVLSPLARALVGKAVDEEVPVDVPNGKCVYKILSVKHL